MFSMLKKFTEDMKGRIFYRLRLASVDDNYELFLISITGNILYYLFCEVNKVIISNE